MFVILRGGGRGTFFTERREILSTICGIVETGIIYNNDV
jgi:hypothetical protein